MRNVFIFLLVILLGFSTNCNADAKKYWEKKRERYEQAKKEAVQEGRTFDPNEFERKERQRIEEKAMSPITVLLILGGVVVVIGGAIVFVSSIGEEIKKQSPEGKFWMIILGIICFILFIVLMISLGGNKSSGSHYDSDEEYWENARMHTDRHY